MVILPGAETLKNEEKQASKNLEKNILFCFIFMGHLFGNSTNKFCKIQQLEKSCS